MRRRVGERRRAPRFRVALHVRFAGGGGGVSRDISAVGIFLNGDDPAPQAAPIRLSVMLGEWDTGGGFRIHGEGRVVRAETAGARPGIALDVLWSDVEPLGPGTDPAVPDGQSV